MDSNRDAITRDITTLCFYMQGSISFNDAWLLSVKQRRIMSDVIDKHYSAMSGKTNNKLI
jgi:hypothetical protein